MVAGHRDHRLAELLEARHEQARLGGVAGLPEVAGEEDRLAAELLLHGLQREQVVVQVRGQNRLLGGRPSRAKRPPVATSAAKLPSAR